jgi:hypothetical protein
VSRGKRVATGGVVQTGAGGEGGAGACDARRDGAARASVDFY